MSSASTIPSSDDQLIDLMIEQPILINRPIVVTPLGVKLCRPSETVLAILANPQREPFVKEDGTPDVHPRRRLSQAVAFRGAGGQLRTEETAMVARQPATASSTGAAVVSRPALGVFERYLTLWVALCIVVGIALGHLLPAPFRPSVGWKSPRSTCRWRC